MGLGKLPSVPWSLSYVALAMWSLSLSRSIAIASLRSSDGPRASAHTSMAKVRRLPAPPGPADAAPAATPAERHP